MHPSLHEFADEARVAGAQARALATLQAQALSTTDALQTSIARAEALVISFDAELPVAISTPLVGTSTTANAPCFSDLAASAPVDAGLYDALSAEECDAAIRRLDEIGRRPGADVALDRSDYLLAATAGLLAGAVDVVLVGCCSPSPAKLATIPRGVRASFDRLLPNRMIKKLERAYRVPYDASTNRTLAKKVSGLYPKSHRFHALGHDPILAWVFGVKDVLNGTLTAIGRDGRIVHQSTAQASEAGRSVFVGILEALETVGGHMLSDVATPTGLPAPLTPLLQLVRVGNFGDKHRTVADVAWYMYAQGYDFRHYLAGDLVSMIVDAVVRGGWIARRLDEGCSLADAMPDLSIPRLRRLLLIGHAVAAGVNAGKVALQRNPLALNWAQWVALFRQLGPELYYQAMEPTRCAAARQDVLDADLRELLRSEATAVADVPAA